MKDFLKVPPEDRYNEHIPIQEISIDCFIINQKMVIAYAIPHSLLERGLSPAPTLHQW